MSDYKKVLIIGGSGMMGIAVQRIFADAYEVVAPSSKELDIHETSKVLQMVERIAPNLIIYAVAADLPEDSDTRLLKAYHTNIRFPLSLVPLLQGPESRLVCFSTDMVFPENKECAMSKRTRST